ncbi:MAG: non-hydrolyzing UDP-N-acetylglucosamine 2-epimerase [Peptococcaceae bacterium]
MLKVMTIVGTRPEVIKLSRVIAVLDEYTDHILVHTGQNFDYELNDIFFAEMRIRKPRYLLNSAGKTPMETIANILLEVDKVLEIERPDAVLIYGDTNSCLSVIAAKRKKIPVFHMEAGNRCFDQRVPEEINRKLVDHLSDINMPISEHARRYLMAEGIKGETIIKTGSAMQEVLNYYKNDITKSQILAKLDLKTREYFVVSAHREENIDSERNFKHFMETLNVLTQKYAKRIMVSTHPRTRKKVQETDRRFISDKIEWLKPLGFFDYIKLQMNAFCVISDSGTIMEEAALLAFPAVTIRNAHERPEGMDEGILIMAGLKAEKVMQAIHVVTSSERSTFTKAVTDYDAVNISDKIVKIIMSYTDYIRRTVWMERD